MPDTYTTSGDTHTNTSVSSCLLPTWDLTQRQVTIMSLGMLLMKLT